MNEREAIIYIKNANEESKKVLIELEEMEQFSERKELLEEYYANIENCVNEIESCDIAISALEEIQQYREIGTVEECREAIECQPEVNNWIPCSERLPEKPGDYWVTMVHRDGSLTTEKMFWCNSYANADAWEETVVAWKPYYCPEAFNPQN